MHYESAPHQWISWLGLGPHPEGGFYRQTYQSDEFLSAPHLPDRFNGRRVFSTAIYFLLTSNNFSAFHRIKQDELWHFYAGSPVTIHTIVDNGDYVPVPLGCAPENHRFPQAVIAANTFFAASVDSADDFALVGCTVAPGFDFSDFELADKRQLLNLFPQHHNIIEQYTRQ